MNNEIDDNFSIVENVLDEIKIINEQNFYFDSLAKLTVSINYTTSHVIGFLNNPYFKVYNAAGIAKSTKVARISMLDGKYVNHKDTINKADFKLNEKDRLNLMKILLSQCSYNGILYDSTWEAMCMYLENVKINSGKSSKINIDFNKLKDTSNIPNKLGY